MGHVFVLTAHLNAKFDGQVLGPSTRLRPRLLRCARYATALQFETAGHVLVVLTLFKESYSLAIVHHLGGAGGRAPFLESRE